MIIYVGEMSAKLHSEMARSRPYVKVVYSQSENRVLVSPMTLRSWSKSPSLPREDVSTISSSIGDAAASRQSVHAAGTSERLPFGRITRTSRTPRRLMLLITASVSPSNAWRLRITVT